jgi:type 1 glutamine amidotransferase
VNLAWTAAALLLLAPAQEKRKALIVDGQSNHADGELQTRAVRAALEETGLFAVDVATSPPAGRDLAGFRPDFASYRVVVSLYNGAPWPEAARKDFEAYVRKGGGFVSVHMADNAFPDWPEYNRMIGLGGWYRRNEKSGPYVYFENDQPVRDPSPGIGGSHGVEHAFPVVTRDADHPITRGLPARWMHDRDELYDRLRGPAEEMTVLATAYSDKATGGSGRHEPVLMALRYGEGRVFHTTLGHGAVSRECVGFIVTLQRGAEWAATGAVTQPVPRDFPTADRIRTRPSPGRLPGVLSLGLSADGKTIASGSEDGVVRFWDLRGAGPSRTFEGDGSPITSVACSPDGLHLAAAGRTLRLWNLERGNEKRSLAAAPWCESVAFSPDNGFLATAGASVDLWDLATGERIFRRPVFARRVAFLGDGKTLVAAGADGRLWFFDRAAEPVHVQAHPEPLDALAIRDDGKQIATGGRDGAVRIWDPSTRVAIREIQPKAGWINDLAFSPDRRLIAVAHRHVTLWEVETGRKVAQIDGRADAVAFSPDGKVLVRAGPHPAIETRAMSDLLPK